MIDVVYPVRPGDVNEELRFSLRTLEANYPNHGRVWIVGHKPNWLTNVEHIPGNGHRSLSPQSRVRMHWNHNVYHNVLAACEHPDTPDELLIFNDDFMLTAPVEHIPVMHHGSLAAQVAPIRRQPKTWWHRSLIFTLQVLQEAGYADPTSYEVHVPMPVQKAGMASALRRFLGRHTNGIPAQWRTLYGVLNQAGGVRQQDPKARQRDTPLMFPYFSTTDSTWPGRRRYFAEHFPKPSRYEKAPT